MKNLSFYVIMFLSVVILSGCGQSEPVTGSHIQSEKLIALQLKELPDLSIAIYHNEELIDTLAVESVNEVELTNWARQLAQGPEGYDQTMRPAKWRNGELVGARDRVVLHEAQLVETILALSVWERAATLPIEVESIQAKPDDVKTMQNNLLGQASTAFNQDVGGRVENIRLSTESVDYVVLGSGDVFTFNGLTGRRTLENGYKEATVIIDGDFVDGVGGGICQTSTTLYNAVLDAGLTVVERHPHSLPVTYVEEGLDAMVSWGTADFRFRNDYDHPVIIRGGVNQEVGEVWFEIRT
ncbi:vancomycin resistance protein YoaR [Alkalihalobacillus xiaoxiensis]|uniref:Vancomycin resistance protein YoaR n=1 Tax=Shouchella xiaoxiensis TaxID=766895 RepID=A0ABS2SPE9_9BACI|nr:VanW family protein [Shouchella xiaoxiensis]MBM7837392.1 vancomycin resistance protein YoaR [Shouchella xiaoxiensis]